MTPKEYFELAAYRIKRNHPDGEKGAAEALKKGVDIMLKDLRERVSMLEEDMSKVNMDTYFKSDMREQLKGVRGRLSIVFRFFADKLNLDRDKCWSHIQDEAFKRGLRDRW